jgi:hypothetical protein
MSGNCAIGIDLMAIKLANVITTAIHDRKSRPVDEYAGKQRLQLLGATFADTTWPAWTF